MHHARKRSQKLKLFCKMRRGCCLSFSKDKLSIPLNVAVKTPYEDLKEFSSVLSDSLTYLSGGKQNLEYSRSG